MRSERRDRLLELLLAAALSASVVPGRAAALGADASDADKAPNIIFILADDLGWRELGCYGNRFNETPHLDELASRGVRFTSAYAAAPVCSPMRASLMTGQYPARVGITDYLRADDEKFLSPDYLTLAEALRQAGYVTGLIGKWHLMGDYARKRGDPSLHGFDEVICSETSYIGPGDYFAPYDFMPEVKARQPDEYLTDRLNDEAVAFIKRHQRERFFLYLSHYAVHTRLAAKPEVIEKFAAKSGTGKGKNNPVLAAMLASIDEGVGRIVAALEELKIAHETVVIFTSDNGGESRVTSNVPLRGGKSQLYEGGIRVPLIVSGPGVARRGRVCHVPVSSVDYYPTCLELAGVKPDPKQVLDGESLVWLLKGTAGLERRAIYWHYPLDRPHHLGGRSAGAVRAGHFKLIEFYDTSEVELYNLKTDIGERTNLAAEMPQRTGELRTQLKAWRARVAGRGGGGT